METCRFFVCERSSRWAIACRRRLPPSVTRVYETRTLESLWHEIHKFPASSVLIEVADLNAVQPTAAWIFESRRVFPKLTTCIGLVPGMQGVVRTLREVGAAAVATSTAALEPAMELLDRHFLRNDTKGAIDGIWAKLPWPSAAVSEI